MTLVKQEKAREARQGARVVPLARENEALADGISTAFVGATAFVVATLVVITVVARSRRSGSVEAPA